MNEITLFKKEQIFGENKSKIIEQYGTTGTITDFYLLLNGLTFNNYRFNGYLLDKRTGLWLTNSSYDNNSIYIVDQRGCKAIQSNLGRNSGIRPVLLWDLLAVGSLVKEIEYGEYPQTIVDDFEFIKLEMLFNSNDLDITGKNYTVDYAHSRNSSSIFMPKQLIEYSYQGYKYIRFQTDSIDYNGTILSTGRMIKPNSIYWVKVEPIEWIVDFSKGLMLSKKILLAGIQFNNYDKTNTIFEESDMYNYLNTIFVKDIVPSEIIKDNITYSPKRLVKTH